MRNILLTCSGRRNYIIDYFRQSLGGQGKIYAANSTLDASSMIVCDEPVIMPSIYDESYIDDLLRFCKQHSISLIVPLFDLELHILARSRELFAEYGITVAVSSEHVCAVSLDKVRCAELLAEAGFNTTRIFTDVPMAIGSLQQGEIRFPLFVKPRLGMGSIAIFKVRAEDQLRTCFQMVRDSIRESYLDTDSRKLRGEEVVIQESLPGAEYGLDVVNDFEGNYVATFVKRKLAMRSGETDGAVTEDVPELRDIGRKLSEALDHVGNLDVDVFWDGKEAYVLDMNPRFGGGYPFSHVAGGNLPAAYLAWAEGKEPDPSCFEIEYGVKSLKGISILRARI